MGFVAAPKNRINNHSVSNIYDSCVPFIFSAGDCGKKQWRWLTPNGCTSHYPPTRHSCDAMPNVVTRCVERNRMRKALRITATLGSVVLAAAGGLARGGEVAAGQSVPLPRPERPTPAAGMSA